MDNQEIAKFLREMADTLEVYGGNPYRVRAFRRAARSIEHYASPIIEMLKKQENLQLIPNVGSGIAAYIKIIVDTGKIPEIIKTKKETIPFRSELKDIPGLGPKRIHFLTKEFNVKTKSDLVNLITSGKLLTVKGFNKKLLQQILYNLEHPRPYKKIFRYNFAELTIGHLLKLLNNFKSIKVLHPVGDFHRKREIIENGEFLIVATSNEEFINEIRQLNFIKEFISIEYNKIVAILHSGLQVIFRLVPKDNLGSLQIFYTGSSNHLNELNKFLKKTSLKITENGLIDNQNNCLLISSEENFYKKIKLSYIPVELREGSGEVTIASKHQLPKLIELKDIKGDLHSHTLETDGVETLENMVLAAKNKGYEYIAITDHSQHLRITNGMDEKRLLKQIDLINEISVKISGITILKSIEVDILENGDLDLPNSVLKELDLCVCSIHSKFRLLEHVQTERIIRAMDNPYFTILGHPTGRLINYRDPYPIQLIKIIEAAKERGCFLELNAQPSRLDLKDSYCYLAKSIGVKLAISTDAHSVSELNFMQFGINQARRGWLEAQDVINTYSLNNFKKLIKR